MSPPRALVSWSSGKDSAWALHAVRIEKRIEPVGLLTAVTATYGRVSIHGVREELLRRQSEQVGLPLCAVSIPYPCSNEIYEESILAALARARDEGITRVVFGDLFLEDVRAYRERLLERAGLEGVFPLWGRDTGELAREMIAGGLRAVLVCVDAARVPDTFAGREFDEALLADLPPGIDPCGERGEFHTFACAGPMFQREIPVRSGEVVRRDGLVFADLLEGSLPGTRFGPPRSSFSPRCWPRRS
jgi:uncharacterized protein (TIGR00290 family)